MGSRTPLAPLFALFAAAACTRLLGDDYAIDPGLAAGASPGGRGGQGGTGGDAGGQGGAPPSPVVEVKAGGFSTCARLSDGTVRCWGAGGPSLGTERRSSLGDDESPSAAGPVDLGGKATQLAMGYHVCALLEGGAVRCWGANDSGQLGYGHTTAIGDDEAPGSAGPV
ncbi:MAG TPA: RCC1 domain-containing protein, partial [Polyangiaceae bacterium]|nr:RCC1 domain-containing protein [Polyangiaceae bacterium]